MRLVIKKRNLGSGSHPVSSRGRDETNPPNWYRRAWKDFLKWYNAELEDNFYTNTLMHIQGVLSGIVKFLKRVQ
jgi:hypothetical protein